MPDWRSLCSRPTDDLNGMILEGGGTCRADSGSVLPLPAILRDEQFVQLDEAISALDTRSEKQFQQAIDVLISRSSMIMAAHRLNTIRKAGRIIRVNEGHVEIVLSYETLLMENERNVQEMEISLENAADIVNEN